MNPFRKIKKFTNLIFYKIESFLYKFSKAKYLVRLDDACTTQKKDNWIKLERIFDELDIKPIVAIIPFNKDRTLFFNKKDNLFWEKVKEWQSKGWQIAIHGHSHLYHEVKKKDLIFPFYNRSEFAGLSIKKQRKLIKESNEFFLKKNIIPKIWISPSHTFDLNTLNALQEETKVEYISDGISLAPYRFMDFLFVPQQLWNPKKKLFGIWTICLHPNTMNNSSINDFKKMINDDFYKNKFIDIKKTNTYEEKFSFLSYIYSKGFWSIRFFKNCFKKHNKFLVNERK